MYTIRLDMRAPAFGAPAADLYAAALDMAEFGESRGLLTAVLTEHHSSPDGYLPSPLTFASAIASRTTTLPIMIAVFMLPLYHPIRLAEQMIVIDLISRGRVRYVAGIGYVPAEYEASGIDFHKRGKIADAHLDLLLKAVTGEKFECEGRQIQVTPAPFTPGGPNISWGGGSPAAAKRAGRFGIDFLGQIDTPELRTIYEASCKEHGHPVGQCWLPPRNAPMTTFVAEDVEKAWEELGPYLMHDVLTYAQWNEGKESASLSWAKDAAALRAEKGTHQILSVDEAITHIRSGNHLALHPLVGGLPPDIGWRYLKVVTEKVMPAIAM